MSGGLELVVRRHDVSMSSVMLVYSTLVGVTMGAVREGGNLMGLVGKGGLKGALNAGLGGI